MGYPRIDECPLTGLPVNQLIDGYDLAQYNLAFNGKKYFIKMLWDDYVRTADDSHVKENRANFLSLLEKEKLFPENGVVHFGQVVSMLNQFPR